MVGSLASLLVSLRICKRVIGGKLEWILFLLLWVGLWGGVGAAVGSNKDRAVEGFWLGVLLGIIGIIIVALMSPGSSASRPGPSQKPHWRDRAPVQSQQDPRIHPVPKVNVPPRQHLMAEAINRDPTLANPSDPAALRRLNEAVDELAIEWTTRIELEQLMALQDNNPAAAADPNSDLGRASNPETDQDSLWKLLRSEDTAVAVAAARNPSAPAWALRRTARETQNETLKGVLEEVIAARADT